MKQSNLNLIADTSEALVNSRHEYTLIAAIETKLEQLSNPNEQKKLLLACETYGVFLLQVSNTSMDMQGKHLFAAENRFFAQPQTTKSGYARTESRPLGFNDQELTKPKRDWKEMFDLSPSAEG